MTAAETEALDRLLELVVLLGDDMTRGLAAEGLSVPRAHLLWRLHQDGPSTQRALSDALGVSPRNITGLVDGLADTGFVTREAHPSDRRATLVSLTEHGRRTLAAMHRGHQSLARTLFGELPAPDLRAFTAELSHVADRLRGELREDRA